MANYRLTTGSDVRNGTNGADTFDGYAGDDGFGATGGADTLNGRGGNDLFLLNSEYSDVSGLIDGGADADTVRAYGFDLGDLAFQNVEVLSVESFEFGATIDQLNSFETITSSFASMTRIKFYLSGEGGAIDASGLMEAGRSIEFDAAGLSSGYEATGTSLADVFKNSHFDDTVHGGLGADSIWSVNQNGSAGGVDQLFGEGGADTFYIRNQSGTVDGGAGTDTVIAYQFSSGFGGNQFGDLGDMTFVNVERLSSGPLTTYASLAQLNSFATITGGDSEGHIRLDLKEGTAGGTIDFSSKITAVGKAVALRAHNAASAVDVTATAGDDILTGSDFNDRLVGGLGDDYLGGAEFVLGPQGRDTVIGGEGDDTYFVDRSDRVIDLVGPAGGIDTIIATSSYDLADLARVEGEIENLTLGGYLGAEDPDTRGSGNGLDNILTGNGGDNRLDGRTGADTMIGGNGDDTFIVDNENDVVRESVFKNQGHDQVLSSVTFELDGEFDTGDAEGFVEDLILTGSADIDGYGNELDNMIMGNAGDNVIDGRGGQDRMKGFAGDDTYYVDVSTDQVVEAAGEGVDTVFSTVSYSIVGRSIEVLTLIGTDNANAVGNADDNTITGNDANNNIRGGEGNDTMTGGGGRDFFVFNSAPTADNADRILDFTVNEDQIRLDDAIFTELGPLGRIAEEAFAFTTDGTADEADDRIVYNATTGELFYDADGSGAGARQFVATIGLFMNDLSNHDIVVV